MLAAGLVLVADEADAVEVGAYRKLLVLHLRLLGACRALGEGLVVQREGEDYVASDLSGVQGAVEAPQLDGAVAVEEGVQVEEIM